MIPTPMRGSRLAVYSYTSGATVSSIYGSLDIMHRLGSVLAKRLIFIDVAQAIVGITRGCPGWEIVIGLVEKCRGNRCFLRNGNLRVHVLTLLKS